MVNKIKTKKAMSLLSLLVVMSMIMVIMAASVPLISRQQTNKISKGRNQTETVSLNVTHGHIDCYYDVNGELTYKKE